MNIDWNNKSVRFSWSEKNTLHIKSIISGPEEKLGNCLYSCTYTILSNKELSDKEIKTLREAGLLGGGQSYNVLKPVYGKDCVQTKVVTITDSSD